MWPRPRKSPLSEPQQLATMPFLIALCIGALIWFWRLALLEGKFYFKAGFLFGGMAPACVIIFCVMIHRAVVKSLGEEPPPLEDWAYTPGWWATTIVSLACGGANVLAMYYFYSQP
jgi:hypothetical protein